MKPQSYDPYEGVRWFPGIHERDVFCYDGPARPTNNPPKRFCLRCYEPHYRGRDDDPERPIEDYLRFVYPYMQGHLMDSDDGTKVIVLDASGPIPGRTTREKKDILTKIRDYLQVPPDTPFVSALSIEISKVDGNTGDA